jgi:hypothetical protein
MWNTVSLVSTGFSLAAFIAAVIAWILKSKFAERERLIRSAPDSQRPELVRDALEFFRINSEKLTKDQQFRLALEQVHARSRRYTATLVMVCILAFVAGAIAIMAVSTKSFAGQDRDPKSCRLPEFGVERYLKSDTVGQSSGWQGGGRSQRDWCNDLISLQVSRRSMGAEHEAKIIETSERSKKDWMGHASYNYFCKVEMSWEPLYNERADQRCEAAP